MKLACSMCCLLICVICTELPVVDMHLPGTLLFLFYLSRKENRDNDIMKTIYSWVSNHTWSEVTASLY